MEKRVLINQEKCIGCGLCQKDCVGFDIELIDGKAVANGKTCIYCGHCDAICPQNAVTITGFEEKPIEFEEQTRLNPEELLKAIQTRRTIRNFTEQEISKEVIDMILEAGRVTPTGVNKQGTSYIVLSKKRDVAEAAAVKMFRRIFKIGSVFIPALKSMKLDDHFFFKKAPLVIVVRGKDQVSASLAAQSMAFMAEANGLGVLFSGFFTTCFNMSRKVRKAIGVSKKPAAATTLVIGYSAVKYHRTTRRYPADITEA